MKSDRTEKKDARAEDGVMTETPVHDKTWGDSAEGPVWGEGEVKDGGQFDRDVRSDPWGGRSVQDVDRLPNPEPRVRPERDDGTGALTDEQTGGNAGIVGEDDRLYDRGK
jgi:hypothetical protein